LLEQGLLPVHHNRDCNHDLLEHVLVLIVLLVRILIADKIAFIVIIWCLVLALTDNKEADL
jgi:hypothetical protein